MQNSYEQLFSHLQTPVPRDGLLHDILRRVAAEQARAARRRLVIFSLGCAGSLAGLIPAFIMMRTSMIESGFVEFFSLLFSDAGSVALYWQNFALTLLESLPAVSIAAFLATVFTFLGALRFLTRDIKFFYYGRH